MSGGHFNYDQYRIIDIAESVQNLINSNNDIADGYNFSEKTIEEFKNGVAILKLAYIYAQRIDWLVCSDDGEDTFHERLIEEINKVEL